MRRTIEDVLVEAGLIDEQRLRHVRRYARHNGVCLARAAVEIGGIGEELLASTLATKLRLPRVDLCARASTRMRCARCRTISPTRGACCRWASTRAGRAG